MSELKPCPFCGSKKAMVLNMLEECRGMELAGITKNNWNVVCQKCFGMGGTRRSAVDAIKAWNRRAEK